MEFLSKSIVEPTLFATAFPGYHKNDIFVIAN